MPWPIEEFSPTLPVEQPSILSDVMGRIKEALTVRPSNSLPEARPAKASQTVIQPSSTPMWPERLVRDALTPAHDALTGKLATEELNPETGHFEPSMAAIKAALDMSALAGTGGLAGGVGEGAALGSNPFLRPALKYKEKLYKAPIGKEHLDALPKELHREYMQQAMSGEDISNFNFGFINHKGQFLSREDALKYAIDNGLVDPKNAKYGVLTSVMDRKRMDANDPESTMSLK